MKTNQTNAIEVIVGVVLVLIGASTAGIAYHVDYDQAGGNPADEWFTLAQVGILTCESQGPEDKVNPNLVTLRGQGGLCYASSQDFASCDFTDPQNVTCSYDKEKEKAKKPFQNDTHADWGFIEPVCKPVDCPADPEAPGFFIRINSNTRSCEGSWGQTFAYKESIACWGGSILNPETGASGHVTFFVDAPLVEGSYNRAKNGDQNYDINDPNAPGPIENPLDATKTADNCTGNGDSWGLTAAIGKKDDL